MVLFLKAPGVLGNPYLHPLSTYDLLVKAISSTIMQIVIYITIVRNIMTFGSNITYTKTIKKK